MQRLVVFDVGGVLVRLMGMPDLMQWTGLSADELREKWLSLEIVRGFESGLTAYEDYASEVITELGLPLTSHSLEAAMHGWMSELFPEAEAIVSAASEKNVVACLCNMNTVQWPGIRDRLGVGDWFEHMFISHEIGMVKPDRAIYEHVTQRMGIEPDHVVFFDDTQANVNGALECGWSAHLTGGTDELRSKLTELDLI